MRPQALGVEALGRMNALAISSFLARRRAGRPLGIMHIHDCLRADVA
jgi:arabinose-5-phosphate isomerase